jgi:hypothetical protein
MKTYVRCVLIVFATYELILGVWLALFPASFYNNVPTVDWTPPYSEHLFRDFGDATLGLAVLLIAAAVRFERVLVLVALVAYLVYAVPHLVFHLGHLEGDSPGWSLALAAVLLLSVLLPASALAAARKAFAS